MLSVVEDRIGSQTARHGTERWSTFSLPSPLKNVLGDTCAVSSAVPYVSPSLQQMHVAWTAHDRLTLSGLLQAHNQLGKMEVEEGDYTKESLLDHYRQMQYILSKLDLMDAQLLSLARDTAQEHTAVALRDLVESMGSMVRPQRMEGAGIGASFQSQIFTKTSLCIHRDVVDRFVSANMLMVERALLNLMNNARQAYGTGTNGTVTLIAHPAVRKADQALLLELGIDKEFVGISVVDTAGGIAPEMLQKLAHPYCTTKRTGTGLGVCMANYTAREHGGMLAVSTEEGIGTVFTLYLPVQKYEQ